MEDSLRPGKSIPTFVAKILSFISPEKTDELQNSGL
jgi:hypothetical protein